MFFKTSKASKFRRRRAVVVFCCLTCPGAASVAQVADISPKPAVEEARVGEAPELLEIDLSGPVYTWRDGDRTLRVWLQRDLAVRPHDEVQPNEKVLARVRDRLSIVQRDGPAASTPFVDDLPVFRSLAGELMTLPGGVLLVFDPEWTDRERSLFFERKGISSERVSWSENVPFVFFVETAPGMPSLELANELAGAPGVEIASPNWWVERFTR